MTEHPHVEPSPRRGVPSPRPTTLIVPGLNGSPRSHWQTAWERERHNCRRVDLGEWHDPMPLHWLARLEMAVWQDSNPVVIVAHSLGCIATALWACGQPGGGRVLGAFLVAPCDPEAPQACPKLRRFGPVPRGRLPFPAMVVASTNDPHASFARTRAMADGWGAALVCLGDVGHINADSNLGAWPAGQALFEDFVRQLD